MNDVVTGGILTDAVAFERNGPFLVSPMAAESFHAHEATWGRRSTGGTTLLDRIERAGITGYGGAHFAAAIKLRAALAAGSGGTVVANAAEGEPDSAKDAALWLTRPHLVLDGLAQVAETIGAADAVVWVHRAATSVIEAASRAIAERQGELPVPVRMMLAPDRYVAGQTSAVVRALRGGDAVPRFVRPGKRSWGDGPPVLIHNTETLARIAALDRWGPEVADGALVTVVDRGRRVVREAGPGTRFSDLIDPLDAGAVPTAVLVGGYAGVWHRWSDVSEVGILSESVEIGAGVVAMLPVGSCGIAATSRIASWMAGESARGCGPCRFGLPELADQLSGLAGAGRTRRAPESISQVMALVDGRGACAHPDGVVRMVRSALQVFAGDLAAHRRGRCLVDVGPWGAGSDAR
ncbi:MAG: NADH-ubiquinone oxidoreductase-F iron-sulfur binding region domain-containing protein [Pseudolysinimonas sp.]